MSPPVVYVDLIEVKLLRPPKFMRMSELAIPLTQTDLDVLALVANGLTNPEIAPRLGFAEASIKNRLAKLYRRFGLHGQNARTQLVVLALRLKLVKVQR